MRSHDVFIMFVSMATMLGAALIMGELARLARQPAILGEILAGILLGPTVLGRLAPDLSAQLFPDRGPNPVILQGISMLAVVLFLLVAGMELDLSALWRQGRLALSISIAGIIVPFSLGFMAAWFFPRAMGIEPAAQHFCFALFIATALSISALPVIARTLLDLNLLHSDLGMLVVASAIFDDLAGWIIFAVILSMLGNPAGQIHVGITIAWTLGFAAFMLTIGRWWINRLLPWVQAHASYPTGVLGASFSLALVGAAITESIGIHAIFGSFLIGVAIGDSPHLREQTRTTLRQFISFIFAPLFFAGIGMKVDFLSHFDGQLTLIVFLIACAGKILGCGICARLGGMSRRESCAIGFGLNARGAMEIILGMLALDYGLISQRLFVALVVMALLTSMMSGPAMSIALKRKKRIRFYQFLNAKTFLPRLAAAEREDALTELAATAADASGLDPLAIRKAFQDRERIMASGLDGGLAVASAPMDGLAAPVLSAGISRDGIDFNSPDGAPANFVFLLLTPREDIALQAELLADLAQTMQNEDVRRDALQASNHVELLASVKGR